MSIVDGRGPLRQAPSRYSGYYRFHTQLGSGQGVDASSVPQDAYYAITPGPRHSAGSVFVANKSFQGLNYGAPNITPVYDLLFREPVHLIGPRTHYYGLIEGETKILVPPGLVGVGLEGIIQDAEIDLLFWREPPPVFAPRSDFHGAWRVPLVDGDPVLITFPCAARRSVRVIVRSMDMLGTEDTVNITLSGGGYDPVSGFQTENFYDLGTATVASGETQSWVFGEGRGDDDMIPDVVQVELDIDSFVEGAVLVVQVLAID